MGVGRTQVASVKMGRGKTQEILLQGNQKGLVTEVDFEGVTQDSVQGPSLSIRQMIRRCSVLLYQDTAMTHRGAQQIRLKET